MMNFLLQDLDISHNCLESVDLSSEYFILVKILNVSGNNLTELKGVTQDTYPSLKHLYIEGNRFTCKYISDFKQSWDDLEVIGDCINQTKGKSIRKSTKTTQGSNDSQIRSN